MSNLKNKSQFWRFCFAYNCRECFPDIFNTVFDFGYTIEIRLPPFHGILFVNGMVCANFKVQIFFFFGKILFRAKFPTKWWTFDIKYIDFGKDEANGEEKEEKHYENVLSHS